MGSKALQALVKKLFSDEEARLKFESDPNSILSQFALTEQEKKAFLNTYDKTGFVAGNSPQLEAAIEPTVNWLAPEP
jgi:hypothetical protein